MTREDAIKNAPDVVVVHHYEGGRIIATEYKSSLGTVLERQGDNEAVALDTDENAPNASQEKSKRR